MADDRADRILHLEAKIDRAAAPLAVVPDVPLDNPDATVPVPVSSEQDTAAPSQDAAAAPAEDGGEDSPESSATPDGKDAPARQNKGVGKRINELTREKYEAQREAAAKAEEAAYWRQQAEAKTQQQPSPNATPTDGRPTLESCGFDIEAFTEKLSDWKLRQSEVSRQQQAAQATMQQRVQAYNERAATFAEAHPDYQETLEAVPIPIPPAVMETIRDSDVGPQVAYHLAQHLDELAQIVKLPPLQAAKAIGKLEDKLTTPLPKPPVSPVTRAPAPPVTLQGKGLARKDLASMEVADHIAELKAKRHAQR